MEEGRSSSRLPLLDTLFDPRACRWHGTMPQVYRYTCRPALLSALPLLPLPWLLLLLPLLVATAPPWPLALPQPCCWGT